MTLAVLKTIAAMLHRVTVSPAFVMMDDLWVAFEPGQELRRASSNDSGGAVPPWPSNLCSFAITLMRAVVQGLQSASVAKQCVTRMADIHADSECRSYEGSTFLCMCAVPCLRLLQTITAHSSPAAQRCLIGAATRIFGAQHNFESSWRGNINAATGTAIVGAIVPDVLWGTPSHFGCGSRENTIAARNVFLRDVFRGLLRLSLYSGTIREQGCNVRPLGRARCIADAAAASFASLVNKHLGNPFFAVALANMCIGGTFKQIPICKYAVSCAIFLFSLYLSSSERFFVQASATQRRADGTHPRCCKLC